MAAGDRRIDDSSTLGASRTGTRSSSSPARPATWRTTARGDVPRHATATTSLERVAEFTTAHDRRRSVTTENDHGPQRPTTDGEYVRVQPCVRRDRVVADLHFVTTADQDLRRHLQRRDRALLTARRDQRGQQRAAPARSRSRSPPTGTITIRPSAPLFLISGPTVLDATTQPATTGGRSCSSTLGHERDRLLRHERGRPGAIRGFVIGNWSQAGILLEGGGYTSEDNFIGVDPSGEERPQRRTYPARVIRRQHDPPQRDLGQRPRDLDHRAWRRTR